MKNSKRDPCIFTGYMEQNKVKIRGQVVMLTWTLFKDAFILVYF